MSRITTPKAPAAGRAAVAAGHGPDSMVPQIVDTSGARVYIN